MEERSDDVLLAASAAGDQAAGAAFVARHFVALRRLCVRLSGDEVLADDVLQDTLLAAISAPGALRATSARAWLAQIARNALVRRFRRRVGEPAQHEPLEALALAAGWGADPSAAAERSEERRALERALRGLSEEDRAVIVLRDLEGMSGEEAAVALELPLAAMKTRLHRARLRLMSAIRDGDLHVAR